MAKVKWKQGAINKANKRLYQLVQKVILTKQRDSDGKKLKVRSGNLKRNIRPILKIENNNIVVDIQVMEYYQYLDQGTKHIKPWFLSEEIMDSEEFEEIMEDLMFENFEEIIFDAVSKF